MNDNSFYSIDRLIEFGMGMVFVHQMIQVVNETIQSMYIPGAPQNIVSPHPVSIYVCIDGNPVGPLSDKEFSNMVSEQKVTKDDLVWTPGMLGWKPLEETPYIIMLAAFTPPPLPK